jgi:hypothetical protein
MRFLLIIALICSFFGESRATTQQDTIPKRGLGITFGFLNTRFYYDSTAIREEGLQQKLFTFNKKSLKNYNMGQLVCGLGGLSLAAGAGGFLATTTDAIFANIEQREGYRTAWQLPVLSIFVGLVAILAINSGKKSIKTVLNVYNDALKTTSDVGRKIEIEPAQSGVGVAVRF